MALIWTWAKKSKEKDSYIWNRISSKLTTAGEKKIRETNRGISDFSHCVVYFNFFLRIFFQDVFLIWCIWNGRLFRSIISSENINRFVLVLILICVVIKTFFIVICVSSSYFFSLYRVTLPRAVHLLNLRTDKWRNSNLNCVIVSHLWNIEYVCRKLKVVVVLIFIYYFFEMRKSVKVVVALSL